MNHAKKNLILKTINTKCYQIIKNRNDNENYKYLIETEDEILISTSTNQDAGELFYGSWTDNFDEFINDENISLFVVRDLKYEVERILIKYTGKPNPNPFEESGYFERDEFIDDLLSVINLKNISMNTIIERFMSL